MEPVPSFPELLRYYGEKSGTPVDISRIRYHRVFVSTRVVIIRHRNVTGQPGNSIVSRALNRRLLVEALADANGLTLRKVDICAAAPTAQTALFDSVIDDLRTEIANASADPRVVSAAKGAAKVLKYLREIDRHSDLFVMQDMAALATLLPLPPKDAATGQAALLEAMRQNEISFASALDYFAGAVAREAALAASASGGLARRGFPPIIDGQSTHG